MEGIYDELQTLDHTSIVPTFRVKMDAARRIIESTRGDVVTEVRRFSLEEALNRLDKRLGSQSLIESVQRLFKREAPHFCDNIASRRLDYPPGGVHLDPECGNDRCMVQGLQFIVDPFHPIKKLDRKP